jgi:TolB protein
MNNYIQKILILLVPLFLSLIQIIYPQNSNLGIFNFQGDIGKVGKRGSAKYDSLNGKYTITGGGTNMWFSADEFHFIWKKVSAEDISLSANITWTDTMGNPHKKACLIIRQSLDTNSAYADAALHGVGLTSLQYREVKGGVTREIQSNVNAPSKLQIEKEGDYVFMSVANDDEPLHPAGGSFRIKFSKPFYIGLGVCAHDNAVSETAVFSNVKINIKPKTSGSSKLESTLEIINIESKDRRVVYTADKHFEAPNWSKDGKYFLFNSNGRIYKLPVSGGEPKAITTGFATKCNNDHGISPDGTQLAISDQTKGEKSVIYILPIEGGEPKQLTQNSPSYWHGWSPDGKTLAFCGERNGEFDIYTIPAGGGEEARLTITKGLDDGPDYSPDGKYIYFNSERTGTMQIWRMKTDGSEQLQITNDEYNNWFAHPSPDGKWIVFLSYEKDIKGHPPNKDVTLRMMPSGGGRIQVLVKLFGGQGTINVPSWSPDSQNIAFVSYRLTN